MMILSESHNTEISSDFFQYRRQLQLDLITFVHILSEAQLLPTSSWLTCLFTAIELLQSASLFFLPNTSWADNNIDVISKLLSVLRLGFITDSIQYDSMLLWIVHVIILSILISGIIIGRWIRQYNWNPSSIVKVVLAISCQSISGIFFIPIILLLLNSLKCPVHGCNDSLYWALMSVTLIVLSLFTGLILMISLIMIHEQPNKSTLCSGPVTSAGFSRAMGTIVLAVLMLLCSSSRALVTVSSLAAAAIAAYVAYIYTMYQPFYSASYRKLLAASLWVISWAAVCKFVNSILVAFDVEHTGMLAPFLIGSILLAVCICLICDVRCNNIAIRPNEQLQSPMEYELKIRLLFLADGANTESIKSLDTMWNECTTRFPLLFTAFLHRGNFYKLFTRRPYIALQMFNKASSLTTSLIEDILVNRARITIVNLHLDAEFCRILNHEKEVKRARSLDSAAAFSLMSFWEEASLISPDVYKIQHLMSKLSTDITAAEACYKAILIQFPNDVSILRSYAGFLIDTMNDTVSGQETSLRATDQDFLRQSGSDHSSGLSEKSMHVILSTDEKSFGIIKAASQAVCRLLGQSKSELEGKHFAALSFNALKSYYTEMLQKLFQDVEADSNKETQPKLLAMHLNRSLIVTEIKLHCFIDSDELLIVGELSSVVSDDHVLHLLVDIAADDSDPRIIACSLQLSNLIGLSPDFVFHERLPVSNILPEFSEQYESYLSSKGRITNLKVSSRQDDDKIFSTVPVTIQMELMNIESRSIGLVCLKSEPVSSDDIVIDNEPDRIHELKFHDDTAISSQHQEDALSSQAEGSSETDQKDPFQLLDESESKSGSDSYDLELDVTSNRLTPRDRQEDDVSLNLSSSHRSDDPSMSSAVTKRLMYSAKRLGLNETFLRQNRKRDRLKRIRIYLLLITLFAFASAVTMHSSTSALLDSWISNLRLVQTSGYLRYLLISIVMMTKRIIQGEEVESARSNLVEISNQFDMISNNLFANRMSLRSTHRDLLFANALTVQKLIDSQIILDKVTLWDAARLVVSSTRSITNTDAVSHSDRHAFFLLQNYETPILRGLNDSTFQYETAGQLTKSKINQVFIAVISVSLTALLLIALFMIRPDICQVEQDSTNLLIRILQVAPKVMSERRAKAVNRLVLLGELESDEIYHRDKLRQAEDIKSHNRNVRIVIKKLRTVSVHEKVYITMKIVIPIVLLSAYYALFYIVDYNAMGPNLSHSSSLINWSSYEQMAIRRVLLDEFNLVIWNNDSGTSGDVITAVNELQRVHNDLVYGDQSANTLSLIRYPSFSTQDNVLFRSACDAQDPTCSNLYNGLLTNGLHVMILNYLHQTRQLLPTSNETWTNRESQIDQLFNLESEYIQGTVTRGIVSLISDISDTISKYHATFGLVLLLSFILALAMTYCWIYSPLTANVAVREKHIDTITKLLPT